MTKEQSTITIEMLAHADFSGHLKRSVKHNRPGYGNFASTIERIRRKNPEGTLFMDAGDNVNPTMWPGIPCVKAISLDKTDVMTLGNHEFDLGRDHLHKCIAAADFPILTANITEKDTGKFVEGTQPYVILEKAGVKIGVLGVTSEYTPYIVTKASFEPFEMHSIVDACKKYVPEIRAAGAEIVVLLGHIPFYVKDGAVSGEIADILDKIPHVDVCIGGHIPGDYAGIYKDTILLKGGFSGVSICHATLVLDAETHKIIDRSCDTILTGYENEPLEPYKSYEEEVTAPFRSFFEDGLCTIDHDWDYHLSNETDLGNFLVDSMADAAGTQIAYFNDTSCSPFGSLKAGVVTAEDITEVVGFNDPIFKAEIPGRLLYRLFELVYVPERYGNNAGLCFSGLIVYIDHTKPAFSKVQKITLMDGTPLEEDKLYTVATSEYMAFGGNDTSEITNQVTWTSTGVLTFDGIFNYIKKTGGISVSPQKRMNEIGRPENDNAPV